MYIRSVRSLKLIVLCGLLLVPMFSLSLSVEAQEETGKEGIQVSGFLGDYSDLRLHPDLKNTLFYRKSDRAVRSYTKIIVDPVYIYLLPQSQGTGVDPEELAMLTKYFREQIIAEFEESEIIDVVEDPGDGVLRLRSAITHVDPSGKGKNIIVKAGAVAASVPGMVVPRVDLGQAAVEVDMIDSQTQERVLAGVASKGGRRFFSFIRGMKKWGDVQAAFRSWAKEFRREFEKIHQE